MDFGLTTSRRRSVRSGQLVDIRGPRCARLGEGAFDAAFHRTTGNARAGTQDLTGGKVSLHQRASRRGPPHGCGLFCSNQMYVDEGIVRDVSVFEDVTDLRPGCRTISERSSGRVIGERMDAPFPSMYPNCNWPWINARARSAPTVPASQRCPATAPSSMRSGAGAMRLRIQGLPPGWFVKTVLLDGVDVDEAEFDLAPGGPTVRHHARRPSQPPRGNSNRSLGSPGLERAGDRIPGRSGTMDQHPLYPDYVLAQQGRYEMTRCHLQISRRRRHVTPTQRVDDPEVIARLLPDSSPVSLDELGQGTLHLRVVQPPTDSAAGESTIADPRFVIRCLIEDRRLLIRW